MPRTSDALTTWWQSRSAGRAVLTLDALSLCEVPWLLAGAGARGCTVHPARATGVEPFSREEATLLFRPVSYRCGRGSMCITSNKGIGDWTDMLAGDEVITTGIPGRSDAMAFAKIRSRFAARSHEARPSASDSIAS